MIARVRDLWRGYRRIASSQYATPDAPSLVRTLYIGLVEEPNAWAPGCAMKSRRAKWHFSVRIHCIY